MSVKHGIVLELDQCICIICVLVYAEVAECNMKQEGLKDKFQTKPQNSQKEYIEIQDTRKGNNLD